MDDGRKDWSDTRRMYRYFRASQLFGERSTERQTGKRRVFQNGRQIDRQMYGGRKDRRSTRPTDDSVSDRRNDRQTDRRRVSQTDRQTDRCTVNIKINGYEVDGQIQGQTNFSARDKIKIKPLKIERKDQPTKQQTDRHSHRQSDSQLDRQTNRQTDRQTVRKTDKQKSKKTDGRVAD